MEDDLIVDDLPSPGKVDDFDSTDVPMAATELEAAGLGEQFGGKRYLDQASIGDDADGTSKRYKEDENAKRINNEQWDIMFERLVAYKAKYGDCLVPKRFAEDPKLGTWVETQRVQYKRLDREVCDESGEEKVAPNKRLNQERLEKLRAIGFAWSAKNNRKSKSPDAMVTAPKPKKAPPTDPEAAARSAARTRMNDSMWEEMYQRLVQYKEKHGDCLVPRKYEEDPRLSTWVETQRALWNRDYRDDKDPAASPEQPPHPGEDMSPIQHTTDLAGTKTPEEWADELTKAGGGTGMDDSGDFASEIEQSEGMTDEEAQQAVAAAAVEAAAEAMDLPLDEAEKLILDYPKRLSKERKEKLDALGMVWSLRSKRIEDHWDEMFGQLVEYKRDHGDCLVPSRYEPNPKLGKWVETQRYEFTKLQRVANGGVEPKEEPLENPGLGKMRSSNPRLNMERLRRLNEIGFEWKVKHKMKRYYDKQWDATFERLLEFKAVNGHCLVPKRYPVDQKLGTWVHTQRIQYRKMMSGKNNVSDVASDNGSDDKGEDELSFRLTDERRKRLEQVGFCWSARDGDKGAEQGKLIRNSYDDQWDAMFERLRAYKEQYGDCLVPKRFKEDTRLGTWVDTQRVQYKKMKKKLATQGGSLKSTEDSQDERDSDSPSGTDMPLIGRLTSSRITKLNSLGFVWSLRDDWQQHYEELKMFKKEHGHCNVPARYNQNRKLGIWVSAQRQQYKMMQAQPDNKPRRSAPLTDERIELLNAIGFTWSIRSRDSLGESWHQKLIDLQHFRNVNGHCNVPSRYPENPELGVWVGTQRTQYRLYMKAKEAGRQVEGVSAMNAERILQLESLGFSWCLRGTDQRKDSDSVEAAAEQEVIEHMSASGDVLMGDVDPEGIEPVVV